MIKQVKDLKPGDNLYILEGYELSISKISNIEEFYPGYYEITWGLENIGVIGENCVIEGDCTSFSSRDGFVFINKENAISWLSGIIDRIKETIEYVKKEK